MLLSIPGAHGLFSHLQEAFHCHDRKHLHLSKGVHAALMDFQWLVQDLAHHPPALLKCCPYSMLPTWPGFILCAQNPSHAPPAAI
jgi:hypothetical protein